MRRFIDTRKTSTYNGLGSRFTPRYVELEIPLNTSLASILYIIPESTHSALVATCWESAFDDVVPRLEESPYTATTENWPVLAKLMDNITHQQYHHGIVFQLNDLDHGEAKWFVASMVGDVSFNSLDDLFCDRTQSVIDVVLAESMRLLVEVQENIPGLFPDIYHESPPPRSPPRRRDMPCEVTYLISGTIAMRGIASF